MSVDQPCVLLGVTGCIAAYKSCEILRRLQKAGVRCKVVMTEHATQFVGPTTFRALSHEPVAVGLFDDPSDPIHHISLAQECDVFLIAPCTANVAAKIACGIADDLLTTTALATRAPLVIAPAMNVGMYEAAPTRANFDVLRSRGVRFVEAESGYLACGEVGRGRLAEPEAIVAATLKVLGEVSGARERDLAGLRVMVTAGPTIEPVDEVRYLTNRSSGKMGYAVARAAVERGAQVVLVSGPVAIAPPEGAEVVQVNTAREMLEAAREPFARCDVAVFTAAVADVRPASPASRKLKKGVDDAALRSIELVENPDILATLARDKQAGQYVVGFAAETNDVLDNARRKLASKNADLIVANDVSGGRVFGSESNSAWLVNARGERATGPMSKDELAHVILDEALCAQK